MRSGPDVQRFLDRKKKEGIDRYFGVSVRQFDFSSKGVNQRPNASSWRDYNLAGTWVYIAKKSDNPDPAPAAKSSGAKRQQQAAAAAAAAAKKPPAVTSENLTAFEREREERIARNKQHLAALNLSSLTAGLKKHSSPHGGDDGWRGTKRRRTKEEDGPVRRSLRGMNIPPDDALANGVDIERRNGTVALAAAPRAR